MEVQIWKHDFVDRLIFQQEFEFFLLSKIVSTKRRHEKLDVLQCSKNNSNNRTETKQVCLNCFELKIFYPAGSKVYNHLSFSIQCTEVIDTTHGLAVTSSNQEWGLQCTKSGVARPYDIGSWCIPSRIPTKNSLMFLIFHWLTKIKGFYFRKICKFQPMGINVSLRRFNALNSLIARAI